jgi:hypothetical protein
MTSGILDDSAVIIREKLIDGKVSTEPVDSYYTDRTILDGKWSVRLGSITDVIEQIDTYKDDSIEVWDGASFTKITHSTHGTIAQPVRVGTRDGTVVLGDTQEVVMGDGSTRATKDLKIGDQLQCGLFETSKMIRTVTPGVETTAGEAYLIGANFNPCMDPPDDALSEFLVNDAGVRHMRDIGNTIAGLLSAPEGVRDVFWRSVSTFYHRNCHGITSNPHFDLGCSCDQIWVDGDADDVNMAYLGLMSSRSGRDYHYTFEPRKGAVSCRLYADRTTCIIDEDGEVDPHIDEPVDILWVSTPGDILPNGLDVAVKTESGTLWCNGVIVQTAAPLENEASDKSEALTGGVSYAKSEALTGGISYAKSGAFTDPTR